MGKEELRQRRPAVNMNFPFQISFDHLLVTLRSNEGCYLLALSASLETEKPNRFQALGDNMSRRHGIWLFCALRASREVFTPHCSGLWPKEQVVKTRRTADGSKN